jgi:hypothetical protein
MLYARTLFDRLISRGLFGRPSAPSRKRVGRRVRPGIEVLEDRRMLSVAPGNLSIMGGQAVYESARYAEFTVGCVGNGETVTVEYRAVAGSADGSDYSAASGVLTFEPNTSPLTVTVPIVDDLLAEEDESFYVELFNAVNASIGTSQAEATILVNDHAPVIDPIEDQTVDEGQQLQFSVSASDIDQPEETLSYSLDAGAPSGASIDSQSGVFSWQTEEIHGPGVYEVTVRVTDSGSSALSSTQTISITVNEVNEAPTTGGLGDVNVEEDSDDTVISLWAAFNDAEDGASGLCYSVAGNSDPSLFTSVSIDAATGELRLDYAANAFGSATITIRATDSGGLSVETSFNVAVAEVNDAPEIVGFGISFDILAAAWIISGSVRDIDDDVTGWSVEFGGILAGLGLSAEVQGDGSFSVTTDLLGLLFGVAEASTSDPHGRQSNIATALV